MLYKFQITYLSIENHISIQLKDGYANESEKIISVLKKIVKNV